MGFGQFSEICTLLGKERKKKHICFENNQFRKIIIFSTKLQKKKQHTHTQCNRFAEKQKQVCKLQNCNLQITLNFRTKLGYEGGEVG